MVPERGALQWIVIEFSATSVYTLNKRSETRTDKCC